MQFKPWRLITAAIHPRFRAIPGESGRAAVPQMTHIPWRWAAISATNFSRPAGRSPADLLQHVLDLLLDCAVDGLGEVDFPFSGVHPRLRARHAGGSTAASAVTPRVTRPEEGARRRSQTRTLKTKSRMIAFERYHASSFT